MLARVGYGSAAHLRGPDQRRTGDGQRRGARSSAGGWTWRGTSSPWTEHPWASCPVSSYYLLNKPAGVVTTADDPEGRPTVLELVPDEPRVFSVGRLDLQTEGLLVLTNDGKFAQLLAHPSFGVEKEYLAEVSGEPEPRGTAPSQAGSRAGRRGDDCAGPGGIGLPGLIRLVIHEGRNRQVRRMCEAVGHPVVRLVRTRIGPVSDRSLHPGIGGRSSPPRCASLAEAARAPPRAGVGSRRWQRSASPPRGDDGRRGRPRTGDRTRARSCPRCWSATGSTHDDLVSILFTATDDVVSMFPATVARSLGLGDVPLMCARELAVTGAVPRCIRVLIHFYTERTRDSLHHVYLEGARGLRR